MTAEEKIKELEELVTRWQNGRDNADTMADIESIICLDKIPVAEN